jgi:hypothetical protein
MSNPKARAAALHTSPDDAEAQFHDACATATRAA